MPQSPLAEGEGFKPPIPEKGIPDFESSAFGHSANLPLSSMTCKSKCFEGYDLLFVVKKICGFYFLYSLFSPSMTSFVMSEPGVAYNILIVASLFVSIKL